MRRLVFLLVLLLVPACERSAGRVSPYSPPEASLLDAFSVDLQNGPGDVAAGDAVGSEWPACTASRDCRYGEKCLVASAHCFTPASTLWALAPDFTLPDRNPNSVTLNQDVSLSGQAGNVVVVYFALST